MTQDIFSSGPVGHTLQHLSKLAAAVGGVGLVGAALLTLASVVGRALFRTPILGDVELVQLSCAVALSAFMPYTQWLGGNITVDFFTTGLSKPAQSRLDALGALLLGIAMLLLGWRTVVGSTVAYGNNETSMLMSIPLWITYALMAPFLLLTGVVAVYKAWRLWTHAGRGASGARGYE